MALPLVSNVAPPLLIVMVRPDEGSNTPPNCSLPLLKDRALAALPRLPLLVALRAPVVKRLMLSAAAEEASPKAMEEAALPKAPALPLGALAPIASVPLRIVVVPVYVLGPESVSVPEPTLMSEPLPLRMPE